jgi:hypothetical protein
MDRVQKNNFKFYDFPHPCDGPRNWYLFFKLPVVDSEFDMLAAGGGPSIFSSAVQDLNKLTPWNRVLLENLIVAQIIKKFPAFCVTQTFIISQ